MDLIVTISNFGNIFLRLFIVIYLRGIISLVFNKGTRINVVKTNTQLNILRKKPYKTVDEQREFLNLLFPKKPPFKWSWSFIWIFLKNIVLMMFMFYVISNIFIYFNLKITILGAIFWITTISIISEIILKQFKLEQTNFTHILKMK